VVGTLIYNEIIIVPWEPMRKNTRIEKEKREAAEKSAAESKGKSAAADDIENIVELSDMSACQKAGFEKKRGVVIAKEGYDDNVR